MNMTIVVGTDGSAHATRAVEWCAAHAVALDAQVVVVHGSGAGHFFLPAHGYNVPTQGSATTPAAPAEDHAELRDRIANEWCTPLTTANVAFRVVVSDQDPAPAIIEAARNEEADLVVVGRRGRGGFAELLVGSTSYALTHHLDRPLLTIP